MVISSSVWSWQFGGKANSLPLSRAPGRFFILVGSGLKQKHYTLAGTKPLVYCKPLNIMAVKALIALDPGANLIKLFTAVSYEFS